MHDHVWGELQAWKALPNVELVAAGDVNEELRRKIVDEFNVAEIYESWQAMLEDQGERLDIIQVAAENSVHADIVADAAGLGIHAVVEKPMAATLAQARRMITAAASAGTRLMINWPIAWRPAFQEMERRIFAGEIGDVRYFKYRSAHNGPREIGCSPYFVDWLYDAEKNGAGALMDYCGYGAVQCARYLGLPDRVTGLRAVLAKEYPLADDNATILMQYPHAFGVAEGCWTQPTDYITLNPIAYGSEGALGIDLPTGNLVLLRPGASPETIVPPAVEAPRRSGPEYFLHCLETGAPFEGVVSPEVSLISQEILEAGLRAADTGQAQSLPI